MQDEVIKAGPFSGLERRASMTLGAIMGLRMLGLFMVLPVFALYAEGLVGASAFLAGLALGIYGLTQAVLQVPFGMLSDRLGRKPVIIFGLLVFALGSLVAAGAESIYGVIAGRALQGAGAIAAVLTALLADLTRPEQRAKAMAVMGISIGGSFVLAIVLGPLLARWIGVPGIFLLTAVLAVGAIGFLLLLPDNAAAGTAPEDNGRLRDALSDPVLLRLDLGIFMLHTVLMASFVVLPLVLRDAVGLPAEQHGYVYLAVMVAAVIAMIPLVMRADTVARSMRVLRVAIALLVLALTALALAGSSVLLVVGGLWLFFVGFNALEATLPALVSRAAPATGKGAALGVYSGAQFLGAFAGGLLGGALSGWLGIPWVFAGAALLTLGWLVLGTGIRWRKSAALRH